MDRWRGQIGKQSKRMSRWGRGERQVDGTDRQVEERGQPVEKGGVQAEDRGQVEWSFGQSVERRQIGEER